jgi:HlyD family secretion protein
MAIICLLDTDKGHPMKLPSFSRVILPVLAVIGIIIAILMVLRGLPDRKAEVATITPPKMPQEQREKGSVAGSGVVEPSSELIEIGTPLSGVVEEIFITAGQQVSRGTPLFRIDTRDAKAAVAQAQAQVRSALQAVEAAKTQVKVAQNQLALFRGVSDARAVSRLEIIDREGVLAQARAQLALTQAQASEARANVDRAQVDITRRTVRAPLTAQILQVRTRIGQLASAGNGPGGSQDPLMTMGVTIPLHVRVDIDENEIDRIENRAPAIISARGNSAQRVTAVFVRAEPQVVPKRSLTNSASERVDVRVLQLIYALPLEGHALFVGQQIDAFLPANTSQSKPQPAGAAK